MIFEMKQISFSYESGNEILREIDLALQQNEWVGILGTSGCGKSTLLKCIGGLIQPCSGNLTFQDGALFTFDKFETTKKENQRFQKKMEELRQREIGIIIQDYALISCLSVLENIAFSLEINDIIHEEAMERADAFLKKFQLDEIKNKYPYELSGGEQQRTAIARALIKEPHFLLADEPTGNLDAKNAKNVLDIFSTWKERTSIVMVTHDFLAASYCDRVILLQDGRILSTMKKGNKTKKEYRIALLNQFLLEENL